MDEKSNTLAQYVRNLKDFKLAENFDGNYGSMGAIIIDGILQSGIRYSTVVKPKVDKYLSDYSKVTTTSEFKRLIESKGVSELINWKESAKTERIIELTHFLVGESVETEKDFYDWLSSDQNIKRLKSLSGIKDKTADYFKILTGHKTNAIDRQLLAFIGNAGIDVCGYDEAHKIVSDAARILNVDEALFDHSIWRFMSEMVSHRNIARDNQCEKI